MVLKNLLHQIHERLIDIFNLTNIFFAEKSILVVENLYQLPPVHAIPACASSSDSGEPTSDIANEL